MISTKTVAPMRLSSHGFVCAIRQCSCSSISQCPGLCNFLSRLNSGWSWQQTIQAPFLCCSAFFSLSFQKYALRINATGIIIIVIPVGEDKFTTFENSVVTWRLFCQCHRSGFWVKKLCEHQRKLLTYLLIQRGGAASRTLLCLKSPASPRHP